MLTEVSQHAYVVKLFGQPWGPKHASQQLAQASILNLSPEHQSIAEIAVVERDSGKEILFE